MKRFFGTTDKAWVFELKMPFPHGMVNHAAASAGQITSLRFAVHSHVGQLGHLQRSRRGAKRFGAGADLLQGFSSLAGLKCQKSSFAKATEDRSSVRSSGVRFFL